MEDHNNIIDQNTFSSLFFSNGKVRQITVPDYQRAYSWEHKQIELFIKDLIQYHKNNGYYFGHFIAEENDGKWEIVDGQQRITTFVLFLAVARLHSGSDNEAYSLLENFCTASYDEDAFCTIKGKLEWFLSYQKEDHKKEKPTDLDICEQLKLDPEVFTRSQRRIVLALMDFSSAFKDGLLKSEHIDGYIGVVMKAHCSLHRTREKSVAVNIFEMHNTRGVALTTLEVVKAMLMKFVYDHGGPERIQKVGEIQREFGAIYFMEERMAELSFRGKMTMDQLLRLHLRIVDDGSKTETAQFHKPPMNSSSDDLIEYVKGRLHFVDEERLDISMEDGVVYALKLAVEIRKSMQIACETLLAWDDQDKLVGDVLILERDLSFQFFLLVCRNFAQTADAVDGRVEEYILKLWERLLFTRDFHNAYYGLSYRDNFEELFKQIANTKNPGVLKENLQIYVKRGFRPEKVNEDLQGTVLHFLKEHEEKGILHNAFHWWKRKMIYVLYKYEVSEGANVRSVMKGTISVEHILPQEWQWRWLNEWDEASGGMKENEKKERNEKIAGFINGIGNLLLVTPEENTYQGNNHPKDKCYECSSGSYGEHLQNRERWVSSNEWEKLILERGKRIYEYMIKNLVGLLD